MKRTVLAVTLACFAAPAAAPAWAQGAGSSPGAVGVGGVPSTRAAPRKVQEPPPSAVPGARAEPTAVAPITKNAIDLPPNEALFDAINRGDLAVAKDAVNRGADLTATNVLGLTPIELAVDLGRNQISFFLLSLRGGVADEGGPPPSAEAAPKPLTRAERLAARRAARAGQAQVVSADAPPAADTAPVAPRTARLFGGGGGSPIPQAGFLGFDAAH